MSDDFGLHEPKLTGKLGYRLSLQGFRGDHSFKSCFLFFSHVRTHAIPPSRIQQPNMHLIPLSSFWGVSYNYTISLIYCSSRISVTFPLAFPKTPTPTEIKRAMDKTSAIHEIGLMKKMDNLPFDMIKD